MTDRERAYRDFEWFAENCLQVQEKDTLRVVPFRLKPVQRRLARAIIAKLLAGVPARFIVLKARREGVSTVVQAIFFWLAVTRPFQAGATISHHDQTTKALFEMTERFYRYLPEWIRPMRNRGQRGTILEFANKSRDPVEVARNPGLQSVLSTFTFDNEGAGTGANMLHRSEVGLWGEKGRSVYSTSTQIVPYAPWTIIVDESTARGVGNLFYDAWVSAEGAKARGGLAAELAPEPFFIPWFEEPSSVLDAPVDWDLDEEELELREKYGVTDAQLAWRKLIGIPVLCAGDVHVFHQEYPAYPEQAFLATGRPFFDQQAVKTYADAARDAHPQWRGDLREDESGLIAPVPSSRGHLQVWEMPDAAEDYLLAADCAEGNLDGDAQCAYVYARSSFRIVAGWHGHIPRDEFGDCLYLLGRVYNDALIAVELNGGWGQVPLAILRRRGYPRLYRRRDEGKRGAKRVSQYGWMTTAATRVLALDSLAEAIRSGDLECSDPDLFSECSTFVYSDTEQAKPEAAAGRHDDRVLTAAIGSYLWLTAHKVKRSPVIVQAPPRRPRSGAQITGYA